MRYRKAAPGRLTIDADIVAQMRIWGAPTEAIAKAEALIQEHAKADEVDDDFELWPENWPTWMAFSAVCLQWRYRGLEGVRAGLDLPGVEVVLGWPRKRSRRQQEIFHHLQLMERAVLDADRELAEEKKAE